MRAVPGRPRIETNNVGILETVLQIATIGSKCGEKRREDMVRTVKTLGNLTNALHSLGYILSRSALYLCSCHTLKPQLKEEKVSAPCLSNLSAPKMI